MKFLTLICLFLTFFCGILSAQPYLDSSVNWRFGGASADFFGNVHGYVRLYYLDGDTVINNQTYYKVYADGRDTTAIWETGVITEIDSSFHVYYAALREEGKRFYMIHTFDIQENLVHDFDMQLGDTISWDECYLPVVVTSIDTVLLGPIPLQRFFLNNRTDAFVIEGAGGTDGFKIGCPGTIGIESNFDPLCYSRNGYFVPMQSYISACSFELQAGTSSTSSPFETLRLYPNPSRDFVRVEMPSTTLPVLASVFDALGRCWPVAIDARGQLDVRGLTEGFYWLQIAVGNKIYAGKLTVH